MGLGHHDLRKCNAALLPTGQGANGLESEVPAHTKPPELSSQRRHIAARETLVEMLQGGLRQVQLINVMLGKHRYARV